MTKFANNSLTYILAVSWECNCIAEYENMTLNLEAWINGPVKLSDIIQ
jgi:hypothetical protein